MKTILAFLASLLFLHGFGGIVRDFTDSKIMGVIGAVAVLVFAAVFLLLRGKDAPETKTGIAATLGAFVAILVLCFSKI